MPATNQALSLVTTVRNIVALSSLIHGFLLNITKIGIQQLVGPIRVFAEVKHGCF